jgi:hypothetical protein
MYGDFCSVVDNKVLDWQARVRWADYIRQFISMSRTDIHRHTQLNRYCKREVEGKSLAIHCVIFDENNT